MLASYLKLAWKVLGRRKFFTFVSLFGVGFTLMVLVVAVAILDLSLGPQPPEVHQDRMLMVNRVRLSGKGNSSGGNVGPRFVSDFLRGLPGVEQLSYFGNVGSMTSRLRSSSHVTRRTDAAYWKVMKFDFLEGGPFSEDDLRNRRMVAVISRSTADKYFGEGPALGKTLELEVQRFQVVGVVKDVSPLRKLAFADVWAPLTTGRGDPPRPELLGGGTAVLLLSDPAGIPQVKAALRERLARFQSPDPRRYTRLHASLDTRFENSAREIFGDEADDRNHAAKLWGALALLAACFMLLPTVNLMNLNVSRILERAPEIGVRKSFGATSRTLVGQFLVENLVLTLLGTALGMLLALGVLKALSESALLPHAHLGLNLRVALAGLALAVLFGVISGIYPAWRMSRLHPVQALKGGER